MELNLIALLVTALLPITIGFIWYHPKVFGNTWMRTAGLTEEQTKTGNMARILGLAYFFSLILAFVMNIIAYHDAFVSGALFYVTPDGSDPAPGTEAAKWFEYFQTNLSASCRTFKHGAFHGAFIGGILIALPIQAINALFERKGFKYVAVNAGYWILTLSLMGGIVAAWK